MTKQKGMCILLLGLLLVNSLSLISAYTYSFNSGFISDIFSQGPRDVINGAEQFLTPFFEVMLNTSSGEFFFAKCLMLILLYVIIYFVLGKIDLFEDKKGIKFIVAAVISILGMRYLPENDFVKFILLPYGTLGVALLTFLPFLIYFYFVETSIEHKGARMWAWILYAIVFLALTLFRIDNSSTFNVADQVYLAGIGLVVLAMVFDSTLHGWMHYRDFFRGMQRMSVEQEAKDWGNYQKVKQLYQDTGSKKAKKRMEEYEKQFKKAPSFAGESI